MISNNEQFDDVIFTNESTLSPLYNKIFLLVTDSTRIMTLNTLVAGLNGILMKRALTGGLHQQKAQILIKSNWFGDP